MLDLGPVVAVEGEGDEEFTGYGAHEEDTDFPFYPFKSKLVSMTAKV